ncbi:MAG: endonuclease/exonuclease/phosphatase family protein [Bacteroidaceae bacterium]|nr:endonuclease/exonuclease/phosphatase family protein [Bacteroidaceae bacterium]
MKISVKLLFITLLCCTSLSVHAERKFNAYAIGFYNLENLFDTAHDVGKNDYEYLPFSSGKWNGMKYTAKLNNMSRALADMGTDLLKQDGCAIIGVSEVENAIALTDLCNQPPLKARNIQFIHIEGPDRRGVDCGLLYNPKFFKPDNVILHRYVPELVKDSLYKTRGFLTVSGTLAGEHIAVIVNHWPSRFATGFYRESAGRQVRVVKDSLLKADPKIKIFIMGDMNDDPNNDSMAKYLGARQEQEDVEKNGLWNPWWNILAKEGRGTLAYGGAWNLFDQIVINDNLLNKGEKKDFSTLKYYKHNIFSRDYLLQKEGKYKGNPLRTKAAGVWLNGYSDHLPVVIYLLKEVK